MHDHGVGTNGGPYSPALSAVWTWLSNWLWPPMPGCCACGAPAPAHTRLALPPAHLCPACQTAAPFPAELPLCPRCSRPLDGHWILCPDCAAGQVHFASALAVGLYRPPLSQAIIQLKYGDVPAVAAPLGALLATAAVHRWPSCPFDAVVPMPLHRARHSRRGYNQALLLARPVARRLGLPLHPTWLRRVRPTMAQATLGRKERLHNLAGAFAAPRLSGHPRILLIDDVMTTGATLSAAARALHESGAARVDVAVLAVSPRPVW